MPATATRKPRSSPQPVHGWCRWIGGKPSQQRLDDGDAILQIVAEGKEASFFFVETILDGAKLTGYRLIKIDAFEQAEVYDVDATVKDWTCDCKDAIYCDRPGGCKHGRGLRVALTSAGLLN